MSTAINTENKKVQIIPVRLMIAILKSNNVQRAPHTPFKYRPPHSPQPHPAQRETF